MKKLKYLIFLFTILLIPEINVFALPTDTELGLYNWPCTGSAFNLGSFAWYYGDFPFYGWNGNGATSSCPYNSQFYSSEFSVFINTANGNFNQNSGRGQYALRFNLNRTLYNGATYNVVVKLIGTDLTYYFNGVSSIDNGRVDSTTLTCKSATECNLNAEITMSSDTSELVLNINSPSEGLNGYYFNDLTLELFYPQISMISGPQTDTTGIENNQQTIINQNQTEINQNNTIINQNSDMLQKQQETNELLEQQQKSQEVCLQYDKNAVVITGKQLNNVGAELNRTNGGITDYIKITKDAKITRIANLSYGDSYHVCFYNVNKELVSCLQSTSNETYPVPNNASYIRFSLNINSNLPQYQICKNGNQALSDDINDLNSSITSGNVDDPDSAFSDFQNMLPQNGVITQLITLPISLFQKILTSLNATCSSFNLGTLYNHELVLPCINVSNYVGSTLWNVIDVLFSGFFVLVIAKKMIATFENFSSMKEGDVLD